MSGSHLLFSHIWLSFTHILSSKCSLKQPHHPYILLFDPSLCSLDEPSLQPLSPPRRLSAFISILPAGASCLDKSPRSSSYLHFPPRLDDRTRFQKKTKKKLKRQGRVPIPWPQTHYWFCQFGRNLTRQPHVRALASAERSITFSLAVLCKATARRRRYFERWGEIDTLGTDLTGEERRKKLNRIHKTKWNACLVCASDKS